jgi:hypothetical protein
MTKKSWNPLFSFINVHNKKTKYTDKLYILEGQLALLIEFINML